jgi:putative ABC transport system permease protein
VFFFSELLFAARSLARAPGLAAVGIPAALGLTRMLRRLLFTVSPADPVVFAAVAVLLTSIALLACWQPAPRATRVDPLEALRAE